MGPRAGEPGRFSSVVQFSPPATLPFAGPEQAFPTRPGSHVKFPNPVQSKRLQQDHCTGRPEP